MSDERIRELERAVEEGDSTARHRLTRETLRIQRGIVAYWPTSTAPHPSAVRLNASWTTTHPTSGETHVKTSTGWALALSSLRDAFETARLARQATLFDLATGQWVRLAGRRTRADLDGIILQERSTTVDALGRPRATVKAVPHARIDTSRFDNRDWHEGLLYDTEWLPSGSHAWRTRTFVSYYLFHERAPHERAPRQKQWGFDTNLSSGSSGLPSGYSHDAAGISLELYDAEGRSIPDAEAQTLLNQAVLSLNMMQARVVSVPAVAALRPSRVEPESDDVFTIEHLEPPMFPFAWPLEIQALQDFFVEVEGVTPPTRGMFLRTSIHGFTGRARLG